MSGQQLKQHVTGERQLSPVANLSNFMDKIKGQMALALPKHLTADRMTRLALTAFSTSPALQKCSHQSIAASIMTAAQLGLEPGINGQCYLIPYKDTCTLVPGWRGLVDLVARSGRATVFTGVIFKDQEYTFTDGAKRDLVIHNETDLEDPADITHAYAIGWVQGSEMPIIELWRISKIEKHFKKWNKVGSRHYAHANWEMYARKIPLLQVIKYLPMSIELANAVDVSHAAEEGRNVIIDGGVVVEQHQQLQQEEAEAVESQESIAARKEREAKAQGDGLREGETADKTTGEIREKKTRNVGGME